MITHLKTNNSQLLSIPIDFENLIDICVNETKHQLLIRPEITLFGKKCTQPRDVAFYSDVSIGYKYSGQIMKSLPLSPALRELLDIVNNLLESDFNGILINSYKNGNDSIGRHCDDESGLSNIGVACISHGASRKFRIRNKFNGNNVIDIMTDSRYMLVMQGDFQNEFTHEIPKEKKIKTERVSFTFRRHLI